MPRVASAASMAAPCASVVASCGAPVRGTPSLGASSNFSHRPKVVSYPSVDCGARELAIANAIGLLSHCKKEGSVMISGSEKRLYKNSFTSSRDSGPPKLSSSTPTVSGATAGRGAASRGGAKSAAMARGGRLRLGVVAGIDPGCSICGSHALPAGSAAAHKSTRVPLLIIVRSWRVPFATPRDLDLSEIARSSQLYKNCSKTIHAHREDV